MLWGANSANSSQKPKYLANSGHYYDKTDCSGITVANEHAANGIIPHSGWVYATQGTGPIKSITVNSGGTGYANTSTVTFGNTSGTGANATVVTSNTGVITAINVTAHGTKYQKGTTITVSGGTGANLALVFGGRGGRTQYEVLVASGSMR